VGFLTVADALMVDVLNELADRADFKQRAKGVKIVAGTRGILSWVVPMVGGIMADLWFRNPDGRVQEVTAWCDGVVDQARAELDGAAPGPERLEVARRLIATRMELALRALAHNVGGGAAAQKLTVKLAGKDANPDDLNALWRGLSSNVTTEMDLRVGDLADAARRSPALVAHLQSHDARTALATLDQVEGGAEFRREWERFMADYGMRGPSEIDITRPRWQDDPASLMQMVLGNLGADEPGLHRQRHAAMAREGEAAAKRLVANVRHGLLGPLHAAMLRRQIRVARNLLPVREHPKFMLIRIMGLARAAMLEAGRMLVDAGRMDAREDIWFLDLIEAIRALENPDEELRARIAQRKVDLDHFAHLTPPRVITSDGEIPVVGHKREDLPAGALAGNPVSAGVVEGIAHVITDPTREILEPGEILVAPFTDPGWTPLFINAAGLVMEVGGLMTHGSVIAREYGIPAVVGVIDATKEIRTGQRVRVNGDLGYVEVLDGEV
jgi:pyruvate,water dikinase